MPYLFTDKSGLEGTAIDAALGGISAGAGRYVFNKFVGAPIMSVAKAAGKYADVAAAYIYAAVLDYFGRDRTDKIGYALAVAGYAPLGDALAKMFGDPSIVASGGSGRAMSNPLQPIDLSHIGVEARM